MGSTQQSQILGVTGTPSPRHNLPHEAPCCNPPNPGGIFGPGCGDRRPGGQGQSCPQAGICGAREGIGKAPSTSSLLAGFQAKIPTPSSFASHFLSLHPIPVFSLFFLTAAAPLSLPGLSPSSPGALFSRSEPKPARAANPSGTPVPSGTPGTGAASPAVPRPELQNTWEHLGTSGNNIWRCPTVLSAPLTACSQP